MQLGPLILQVAKLRCIEEKQLTQSLRESGQRKSSDPRHFPSQKVCGLCSQETSPHFLSKWEGTSRTFLSPLSRTVARQCGKMNSDSCQSSWLAPDLFGLWEEEGRWEQEEGWGNASLPLQSLLCFHLLAPFWIHSALFPTAHLAWPSPLSHHLGLFLSRTRTRWEDTQESKERGW